MLTKASAWYQGFLRILSTEGQGAGPGLTPTSIKFNRFLKSILLEHKPLLACFGFVTSPKWLVSGKINLRKRLNLIDVAAECGAPSTSQRPQGSRATKGPMWGYPRCGLGAVGVVLEPFCGHLSPKLDKVS